MQKKCNCCCEFDTKLHCAGDKISHVQVDRKLVNKSFEEKFQSAKKTSNLNLYIRYSIKQIIEMVLQKLKKGETDHKTRRVCWNDELEGPEEV